MQHIVDYLDAGKPVIGMRTATHGFAGLKGKFAKYNWNNGDKSYPQGFGRQILGETWVNHHGGHGSQNTRGILAGAEKHPIFKGIKDGDIWGPTDVYTVRLPLMKDCQPLVLGQVLVGMKFTDKALEGKKNDPMMPIAWTRTLPTEKGTMQRVFTTTMGASQDLDAEGTRRMLVNAAYWCVGLENRIADRSNVEIVGEYKASRFAGNGFKKGVRPSQLSMK